MSLWSINAAKKKDEVPGTSKWVRRELFTLHDLMVSDAEQFAYAVASDLTWIDEQMDEIITATEKQVPTLISSRLILTELSNPRLLLESPRKLRGEDSPVKKLREQALALKFPTKSPQKLAMKSPLRELDTNAMRLSPVKFNTHAPPSPSPTKPQKIRLSPFKSEEAESTNVQELDPAPNPFFQAQTSTQPAVQESISPVEGKIVKSISPLERQIVIDKPDHYETKEDNASVEENSFQAIRTAIRKSIVMKSQPANDTSVASESSFKSADEGIQPSSMVVNPTSSAQASQDGPNVSVETVKVPLKDETSNQKKSIVSNTPPPKRESQGFALLPHRAPLAVKSAKKKDPSKVRLSIFNDDISIHDQGHSPQKISLYPTLSTESETPSNATTAISPLEKVTQGPPKKSSPMKKATESVKPSRIPKMSPTKPGSPAKLESPEPSPSKAQKSPLSNLFASVNSTLKRARSKFIKETQHVVDPAGMVHKPHRSPPSLGKQKVIAGPNKWTAVNRDVELLTRLTVPTEASQAKVQKEVELKSPAKAIHINLDNTEAERNEEDHDLGRSSLKFSPVKSIYGSLRREMNQATISPAKNEKKITVPRNLTRVSLTKPDEKSQPPRKSLARSGLIGMTRESKMKNHPNSLVTDQHVPLKRKTQTEDEVRSNGAYRKIGTKIVAPSTVQAKVEQDAKRRRTAEQMQTVLQKRALRVSQTGNQAQEEKPPISVKPTPKYAVSGNQTLMRTAVLQHARMNNEGKPVNTFQSSGSTFSGGKSDIPTTPKAPMMLPEIFSESDDDEEGSVLKDWANSPELRHILMNQQHIDPDKLFGPVAPLQMEDIFQGSRAVSKFKNRGSSAQWTRDGLTTQEVESYKSQAFKR